jgi:NHLM bacteriocin system secretion protein
VFVSSRSQPSSPEALDTLMIITSPASWAALSGLTLLVVLGLVWSFVGRVPSNVTGPGILVRRGGILDVVAIAAGPVLALDVEIGDVVQKGDLIAKIAQPELENEISRARENLEELRTRQRELSKLSTLDQQLQGSYLRQKRTQLRTSIAAAKRNQEWLQSRLDSQTQLLAKGLIAEDDLQKTRLELQRAKDEIRQNESLLGETSVSALARSKSALSELTTAELEINEAARNLQLLEEKLRLSSELSSPHTGRVIELRANEGDVVSIGSPILNLEPIGDNADAASYEVVLYVPSGEGKKIRPGMQVRITPSTVQEEEYGFIAGKVTFVSDFPTTLKGMMRMLENEELVRAFMEQSKEPALTIRAEPARDPNTPSGFKWSSGKGPAVTITSGTPCKAAITVREQRPIALLLPSLADLF